MQRLIVASGSVGECCLSGHAALTLISPPTHAVTELYAIFLIGWQSLLRYHHKLTERIEQIFNTSKSA